MASDDPGIDASCAVAGEALPSETTPAVEFQRKL
jgi:hypothetical protein